MPLAALDDLKRYLDKSDSGEDALLDLVLGGVSDRMVRWIGQPIELTEYTNERHTSAGYSTLVLGFGPINEILSISENGTLLETDTDSDLRTDDWEVIDDRSIVRLSSTYPAAWVGQVIVSYKAGFNVTPEDLRFANVEQAAFEYRSTKLGDDRIGLDSRAPQTGDGVSYTPLDWLPNVKTTMARYRGPF